MYLFCYDFLPFYRINAELFFFSFIEENLSPLRTASVHYNGSDCSLFFFVDFFYSVILSYEESSLQ